MPLFSSLSKWLAERKKKKEAEKRWASYDYGKPAKPDKLLPLDPNDPWKT